MAKLLKISYEQGRTPFHQDFELNCFLNCNLCLTISCVKCLWDWNLNIDAALSSEEIGHPSATNCWTDSLKCKKNRSESHPIIIIIIILNHFLKLHNYFLNLNESMYTFYITYIILTFLITRYDKMSPLSERREMWISKRHPQICHNSGIAGNRSKDLWHRNLLRYRLRHSHR